MDREGTPVPPSIPEHFFAKPDFDRMGLGHWDDHKKMVMGSKILGTKIQRWRSKNVKTNRTIYHTKKSGVGIWQGWCDCVGHEALPCKLIRDVLDIKNDDLKNWNWDGWDGKIKGKANDKPEKLTDNAIGNPNLKKI